MSQMMRTYSRKGKRPPRDTVDSANASPERGHSLRKRPKITVEVLSSESSSDAEGGSHAHVCDTPGSRVLEQEEERVPDTPLSLSKLPSLFNNMSKMGSTSPDTLPSLPKVASAPQGQRPRLHLKNVQEETRHLSSSPATTVSGVAKRMLRRTKTESSADVSRSNDSLSGSSSLHRTPSRISATRTEPVIDLTGSSQGPIDSRPHTPNFTRSQEDTLSPDKGSIRPSTANSSARTYAGKSRSFLVTLPASHAGDLSQAPLAGNDFMGDTQEEDFESRESYADLRARWGVDNSEDEFYPAEGEPQTPSHEAKGKGKHAPKHAVLSRLPNGMMNDLKSITELRSKGESRRFLDEMGYLFEGLDASGALGVRRGSALELVTKLCDSDFARKAKAADFLSRAWEALRAAGGGSGDKVLDTILALFAAFVSRDSVDLTDLATRTDFIPVLYDLLSRLTSAIDPLWLISCGIRGSGLKAAGVSRVDATLLEGLHDMIKSKAELFEDSDIISNRLLVSRALAAGPPILNEPNHLPNLLKSLQLELEPLSSRVSAYMSGLPMLPSLNAENTTDVPSLSHIDNCLRLVESYLLGRWDIAEGQEGDVLIDSARDEGLGKALLTLCMVTDVLFRERSSGGLLKTIQQCMESAFRVLVNLTHDSLPWCQASIGSSSGLASIMRLLATCYEQKLRLDASAERHETVANDGEDDGAQCLDRLCLILGLLTNLVQTSDDAKNFIRDIQLCPQCPGKRTCTTACRCASSRSALECLALIYTHQGMIEKDFDSILRGHIAVLFGLLMQGQQQNQVILFRALPGPSTAKKVETLMDNVREFSLFYAEFIKKAAEITQEEEEEESGLEVKPDERLSNLHGDAVVRQVLNFFEELVRTVDR